MISALVKSNDFGATLEHLSTHELILLNLSSIVDQDFMYKSDYTNDSANRGTIRGNKCAGLIRSLELTPHRDPLVPVCRDHLSPISEIILKQTIHLWDLNIIITPSKESTLYTT